MKALVLAGGQGMRLRPLTRRMPKQLIPVGGRPVLFHGLEALARAGLHEVGIVVGEHGRQIEDAVGDGRSFGLAVRYLRQSSPLGLAHGVRLARTYLGDEPFMLYLGDNVLPDDAVTGLVERYRSGSAAAEVLLAAVSDPRAYGIAELRDGGRVTSVREKPDDPASDLALIGAYAFGPAVHDAVDSIQPSDRGELEITTAVQWLIEHGHHVHGHVHGGCWWDTGQVSDLLSCNRALLDGIAPRLHSDVDAEVHGPVVVGAGARVRRSRLTGPVYVGPSTSVTDADIGPHVSVGARCWISSAALTDSIVLDRQSVRDRAIASSVVAFGCELTAADARSATRGPLR